jgi:peptide/nickel transport system ATP-binding protein
MRAANRLFVFVLIGGLSGCSGHSITSADRQVVDGFEGGALSDVWSREKLEPGAVEMQTELVRSGRSAAKITVHAGDKFEQGGSSDKGADSERDELLERKDLYSHEGRLYRYAFSIFIPPDFPIVPTRLVLAQWKQKEEPGATVINPVIALRYVEGKLSITVQTDDEKKTVYKTRDDIKGKWLDFVFHIRFDRTGNGFLRAWLNGKEIANLRGPTAYGDQFGYGKDSLFYFKMGLYRDRMAEPMTAYFDEYAKRPLREDELDKQ